MTSGQPPAKIESDQCQKLALHLRQRKLKAGLPPVLSLFNIGRMCAAAAMLFVLVLWWGSEGHCVTFGPGLALALGVLLLPFLLLALYQGARLGFFGLAEFICGLSYWPMGALGGPNLQKRAFYTMGLINGGVGRYEEALKYFRRHDANRNVFDSNNSSPWNERHRLPELLSRLGRQEEAWALAAVNVEQSRRDLKDIDCQPVRANLQCDLIVAALVLTQSGDGDKAAPYLEEACALDETVSTAPDQNFPDKMFQKQKASEQTASELKASEQSASELKVSEQTDSALKVSEQTVSDLKVPDPKQRHSKILALYARGLLSVNKLQYAQAIEALEPCRDEILQMRSSEKLAAGTRNSELLGYSQMLLGQCYLRCGSEDKLEGVVTILAKENRSEPPTSVDKIYLDLTEADYKMSQGKGTEALAILEKTIVSLSDSDAQYDQMLVLATQKYQELLLALGRVHDGQAVGRSIDHLLSLQSSVGQSSKPPLVLVNAARLPDLSATKHIANRSVTFFIVLLGYTVINAYMNKGHFDASGWGLLTFLAFIMCARNVFDQVQHRKASFFADQAVAKGTAVDVVLKPLGQHLPGIFLKNCCIEEGPADLLGRKLEIGISSNLVYASQASLAAQDSSIRARLYQSETSGKVLAIETLGRVLTVKKESPGKAAKTL